MKAQTCISGVISLFMTGAAWADNVPVVLNPLRAGEGYMFDWIFFVIVIPIPLLLYLDMVRSRRP